MLDRTTIAALFVAALAVPGCQMTNARYVSKGPDTGEIALGSDTPANREQAHKLMAAHFPGGYEIVWEREKVVGQTVQEHVHQHNRTPMAGLLAANAHDKHKKQPNASFGFIGMQRSTQDTHVTTSTHDKSEWRIQYRRKGSPLTQVGGSSIGHLPVAKPSSAGAVIPGSPGAPQFAAPVQASTTFDTIVPAGGNRGR